MSRSSTKTKTSDSIIQPILDYRVTFQLLETILQCLIKRLWRISLTSYFMFNAISLLFSSAMKIHIILSMFQHKLFQSFDAFDLKDEKKRVNHKGVHKRSNASILLGEKENKILPCGSIKVDKV